MEAINYLKDSDSKKCVGLINRMLKKSWLLENIPEKSENVLLIHFLTSPTWPGFLQFFGKSILFQHPLNVYHFRLVLCPRICTAARLNIASKS